MRLCTLVILLIGGFQAWAQGENNHWAFTLSQGLSFTPSGPVFESSAMVVVSEANATISDAQGQRLFYTNGVTVWDRQGQRMTNACASCNGAEGVLSGHISSAKGTLIVKKPGSTQLYYIFTTDALENQFAGGLTYTEVDMSLRGGLGGITAVQNVRLPTPTLTGKVTEGIAGMQHANRRDVWVLVHGQGANDSFYSFLVTAAGVSAAPVASRVGNVGNRLSIMKFAPDGRRLARCGGLAAPIELFDFSSTTGQVSNLQEIAPARSSAYRGDLEFSPDARKLYTKESDINASGASTANENVCLQFDLQAGSVAAIQNSRLVFEKGFYYYYLELGPDGRIYTSPLPHVGVIDRPNRRGSAASFRALGVPLPNGAGFISSIQNIVRMQPPALDFMAETACAGSTVQFAPYDIPTGTGPLTWTFYDPATGIADSVQGVNATRTYPTAGTFSVTLSTTSRGQYYRLSRYLVITPLPVVSLPADTVALCSGSSVLQLPAQLFGTTVRWSDGSTDRQLTVTSAGKYWVEVRSYQGCTSADTVVFTPCLVPNIITPNGDLKNETFRLQGVKISEWHLEIYNRWGQLVYRKEGYDNRWNGQGLPGGIYFYLLRHPRSGQRLRGWVEVMR
ncbi:gliding motility-associated C-terminal domain-containing protein [Hymenobacter sp. BT770]|uniref:T9SS type B sorting domain-containing protein n=1 Tax=Hymenobacter sp. BT770 TaxID=2886942 RepID=UPI001D1016E4|nr:gliding motility-associated C-terminal domain-containing protein [Hymenobacter sp. BT770]MCC3153366.1 gliding motility-associated C-terminal domain-containing protein [Hymenobacter sp. BT770]MDO3415552.1 gliding motility-associated C-terminal domain-containing protein [Hymenobacter sp. BT770]